MNEEAFKNEKPSELLSLHVLLSNFSFLCSVFTSAPNKADTLDLCPVLSLINFSSTPLLKRLETQVTRKQWAVFRLIPAALHKFGKIEFKV